MEEIVYQRSKYLRPMLTYYCAGCQHGIVSKLITEVVEEMGLVNNFAICYGIGCYVAGLMNVELDMFPALHGRAGAVATGFKRMRPDQVIVTYQGDGDCASIGLGDTLQAAARGENFTTIMVNNQNYGCTGGQGVQVLCTALAKVVDDCGMNMCLYPWYSGQRRGGATYGRLIISDERIGAPEKRNYDIVVLLDEASARDYGTKRKSSGTVIINSDLIDEVPFDDVTVLRAPFSTTAESTGNERCFNLVVGGYLAAYTQLVPLEKFREEMLQRTARNEEQRAAYGSAFDSGVALWKQGEAV